MMYGLIVKMTAQPGHRDELAKILIEGVSGLPGCWSYIVAVDPSEPDVLWIGERGKARKRIALRWHLRRSERRSPEVGR